MKDHKNLICADLYYGWHECEDGIYHAFELQPDGATADSDAVSGRLAKLLDTTPDDPRFNWNVMRVAVPLKDDPVEAAKQLPPEVLEAAFRLKLREYSIEDAKTILKEQMESGFEEQELNRETYGFTLEEACDPNSPHYLCDLIVDKFEDDGTWLYADYDTMSDIVRDILTECAAAVSARREAEEASKAREEKLYFVRAIGKDVYKDFEPEAHSAALVRVYGIFQDAMKNHPWIETDDCAEIDEGDGEFTVAAEEFYQTAYILPVNAATGPEYLLEEIRRAVAAADCATTMYQHTLEDCGTYDYTYHIRELTNQLQAELMKEREERQ